MSIVDNLNLPGRNSKKRPVLRSEPQNPPQTPNSHVVNRELEDLKQQLELVKKERDSYLEENKQLSRAGLKVESLERELRESKIHADDLKKRLDAESEKLISEKSEVNNLIRLHDQEKKDLEVKYKALESEFITLKERYGDAGAMSSRFGLFSTVFSRDYSTNEFELDFDILYTQLAGRIFQEFLRGSLKPEYLTYKISEDKTYTLTTDNVWFEPQKLSKVLAFLSVYERSAVDDFLSGLDDFLVSADEMTFGVDSDYYKSNEDLIAVLGVLNRNRELLFNSKREVSKSAVEREISDLKQQMSAYFSNQDGQFKSVNGSLHKLSEDVKNQSIQDDLIKRLESLSGWSDEVDYLETLERLERRLRGFEVSLKTSPQRIVDVQELSYATLYMVLFLFVIELNLDEKMTYEYKDALISSLSSGNSDRAVFELIKSVVNVKAKDFSSTDPNQAFLKTLARALRDYTQKSDVKAFNTRLETDKHS